MCTGVSFSLHQPFFGFGSIGRFFEHHFLLKNIEFHFSVVKHLEARYWLERLLRAPPATQSSRDCLESRTNLMRTLTSRRYS